MALKRTGNGSTISKYGLILLSVALLVLGLSAMCCATPVVFVCGAVQADGDGSSWTFSVPSIQQGIDIAAQIGGEVWVQYGVYNENIYLRSGVFVYGGFWGNENQRSQRNPSKFITTIDGGRRGSVVSAIGITNSGIDGFTIRSGSGTVFYTGTYLSGTVHGGGLYIHESNIVANNNIFVNNLAPDTGGAIHAHRSTATITNNIFQRNRTTETLGSGGAVYLDQSDGTIAYNTFEENDCNWDGGGIHCTFNSSPVIERNLFIHNRAGAGGAIHANFECSPRIVNNTIFGNWARNGGGGVSVYKDCNPTLVGNVITSNSADEGGGFKRYVDSSSLPAFAYNDFYDNGANPFNNIPSPVGINGNISADPRFADSSSDDFRLRSDSPCINTGDPAQKDSDGTRSDMGALPFSGSAQVDTPPSCWITSSPADKTTNSTVSISWAGSDDRTPTNQLAFSYRFDSEGWSSWTNKTLVTKTLNIGIHTFEVTVRDTSGNTDPTPASVTFEIIDSGLDISDIKAADITSSSVRVTWNSNKPGYGSVSYGLDYSLSTKVDSRALATSHEIRLVSLLPNKTYYFRVSVTTLSGITKSSDIQSFTTSQQIVNSVNLYAIQLFKVGYYGYVVSWRTNVPSTSQVEWGRTLSYGNSKTDGQLVLSHMMYTDQFYPPATYHIRLQSVAANGAIGYSDDIAVTQ